jgi:hypothetical protein
MPDTPVTVTTSDGAAGSVRVRCFDVTNATSTALDIFYDGTATTTTATSTITWAADMTMCNSTIGTALGTTYQQAARYQRAAQQQALAPQPSPEEAARQFAEHRARVDQELAITEAAERRARELLIEHLTEEQRQTLQEQFFFVVIGSRSGLRYHIQAMCGVAGNIRLPEERLTLCAHLTGPLPLSDHLLAQKLWIEHNEPGFRAIAHSSRY